MKFEPQLAWPCRDCGVRSPNFCDTLVARSPSRPPRGQDRISQAFLRTDKDEIIRQSGNDKRLSARGTAIRAGVYQIPLGYTDIADAAGLTSDDVSRAIKDLRADCIGDLAASVLTIRDPARLENYAMAPVH